MIYDRLQLTIDAVRLHLMQAVRWRLAWRAAAAIGVAFWVGLAVDRMAEPSPRVRALFWTVVALAAIAWWVREAWPLLRRRFSDDEIAQLIAVRLPKGADALLTAVNAPPTDSPQAVALLEATRTTANTALAKRGPLRIVRPWNQSGWPWLAVMLLSAAAMLALIQPASLACYARRLALSPEAWPRAVRLVPEGFQYESSSGDWVRKVARGEPCEVTLHVDLSEGHRSPGTVRYQARWVSGERLAGTFVRVGDSGQEHRLRIDATTSDVRLRVRGGDCHLRLRVEATTPPAVVASQLRITPPSYLHISPYEEAMTAVDTIPEGSKIVVTMTTTKPLSHCTAEWVPSKRPEQPEKTEQPAQTNPLIPAMNGTGEPIEITLPAIGATCELAVGLVDIDGVASVEPYSLLFDMAPDQPPTLELRTLGVVRTITRNARVPLRVSGKDDHGMGKMELFIVRDGKPWYVLPIYEASTAAKDSVFIDQEEVDLLSLRSTGKEAAVGDRLTLRVRAVDRYDLGPAHLVTSEPITLRVVTPEEILARLGETELALRKTLEGALSDAQRLAYSLDHRSGSQTATNQLLDTRKLIRLLQAAEASFITIREEVINNRLDQPVMVQRLSSDIIDPLDRLVDDELQQLEAILKTGSTESSSHLATRAVKGIEAVLDRLERRESYNEVVALLRGLIREQRQVNEKTEGERRARVRRSLLDE